MIRIFLLLLFVVVQPLSAQEGRVMYQPVPDPQLPFDPPVRVDAVWGMGLAATGAEDAERELVRRIAEVYTLHVAQLQSQLAMDILSAEKYLLESLTALQSIVDEYPESQTNRRYAELYRTVMIEYQSFYGITEPIRDSEGEIFAILEDMFAVQDEFLENSNLIIPRREEPMSTTVPLIINAQVQSQLVYLTQRRPEIMERWLERSKMYFPMMRRIFQEEGVPLELIHLSMIESGLVPVARSSASAVGLWQFIKATGGSYGLEVNYWVDERRDPLKSTRAAARHLNDLYAVWGDWHLALANYNVSPRRIRSSIALANGQRDYWAIYPHLPRETRGYVPAFIAATMVAMNPEDFGFTRVSLPEEQTFDVVEIKGSVALSELAKLAGITTEEMRNMNPELLRWATPPGPRPYPLKIPVGRKDAFVQDFEGIAATAVNDITIHTVKRGESLGMIANRYSITVRELMAANDGLRSTIHPGQTITVPVPGAGNVAISADSPSRARTAAVASPSSTRAAATTSTSTYRVRSGDNLWEIAKRHNMTVNQLKQMNNLRSNTVRPGQVLRVSRRGS